MNLVTPDSGLIFWMCLIFAIVFFILAKFGFPVITSMVEKRQEKIEGALKAAEKAEAELADMEKTKEQMLCEAKQQQAQILGEAAQQRESLLEKARRDAEQQSERIIAQAREQIATERENALREVRSQVSLLSVSIAEKVLERELAEPEKQQDYIDKMLDELKDVKK